MDSNKIRIAVIGCSSIANRSVIPSILNSTHFKLITVASRNIDKAKDFSERFKCGFSTYDAILNSMDIDAVYVSLPVGLHFEWGKKVLQSGKHLLMEKTFTDSYDKAVGLINLSNQKEKICMEGLVYIYHPLFQKVKSIISSGELGELRQLDAYFGFPYLPETDIRNNREIGGGAILDTLIYPLSLALYIQSEKYQFINYNIIHDSKYNIDARGYLRYDTYSFTAHINYGFGFMYRNFYSIWGDLGYLEVDHAFTRPAGLPGKIKIVKQNVEKVIDVNASNHFDLMVNNFALKIRGVDKTCINEKNDILNRMMIISEMYQSFLKKYPNHDQITDLISVVIPVYNSATIIENTIYEIEKSLSSFYNYEIVLINDGSSDNSLTILKSLAEKNTNLKIFNLMKNFGQHNAIMAGLNQAKGVYLICMDDDGQHDPNDIRALIIQLKNGFDVVYVNYAEKKYGKLKKLSSRLNNLMTSKFLNKPKDLTLCSFKGFSKRIKDEITKYQGPYPYIDGLIINTTRNICSIQGTHRESLRTSTSYSLKKLFEHWLNTFTNFSLKPLRYIFHLGLTILAISLIIICIYIFYKLFKPEFAPSGWTALFLGILFFGSLQLISIGILGEYIGRILLNVNKNPQYIIKEN